MKIYLDVCCLNRPFDDLSSDRVRLEAEAVSIILERCEIGLLHLVSSKIIDTEISRNPNHEKREAVKNLQSIYKIKIELDDKLINRAKQFEKNLIKPYDALHIASAEKGNVEVFITTDDKLLNRVKKMNLNFKIMNPLDFVTKEIDYE